MTTSYAPDHASALADVKDAGIAVTFTLTGQGTYNPATDTTTPGPDVVVTGWAVEKKGSLFTYQALGLVVAKSRTLFFVPDTYGALPPLSAIVSWGGANYAVKNVAPIAPNAVAIGATIVVSL